MMNIASIASLLPAVNAKLKATLRKSGAREGHKDPVLFLSFNSRNIGFRAVNDICHLLLP